MLNRIKSFFYGHSSRLQSEIRVLNTRIDKIQKQIEENIQFTQTNQKKSYILEILQIISNIIPIMGLIATLFGGLIAYTHLNKIHQTSILPDIYGTPANFLAIFIVFFIYFFILFLIHGIPYFLAVYWIDCNFSFFRKKSFCNPFIWLFMIPNIFAIPIIFLAEKHTFKYTLPAALIFIFLYVSYIKCRYRSKDFYIVTLSVTIIHTFFSLIYILLLLSIAKNQPFAWVIILLYMANLVFSALFIKNNDTPSNTISNKGILIIPPMTFSLLTIYFFFLTYSHFSSELLRPVHFIEYPKDASWYIINNNFQKTDGTQEVNGINKGDLQHIKARFINPNAFDDNLSEVTLNKLCRNELPLDRKICFNSYYETLYRSNALYGYMVWNLGNTKVFCPERVKFTDNARENKQLSKQCLLIDGKYLQILDEQYITSDLKP